MTSARRPGTLCAMPLQDAFARLGLALAIGFLIGVERGWKQRGEAEGQRAAGLRTYALAGLLGGAAAIIGQAIGALAFAAVALGFSGAFVAFKLGEARADDDRSATGAVAGLTTFALGALAVAADPALAAAAGVSTAAVLAFKDSLHAWLHRLDWSEVRSAILVLAMTFVVLPVLPDQPLDPFGLFNPRELWLLTVLIAAASFVGYIALRMLGARAGLMAGALVAALVSSTVATADLARRSRTGVAPALDAAAAAAGAHAVMLGRVSALTAVLAPAVFAQAWPALVAAGLTAAAGGGILFLTNGSAGKAAATASVRNPLDLAAVLQFGAILGVLLVVVRVATRWFGEEAILPFAAMSGLLDVDAVVLAMASLAKSTVPASLAADAILLATAADTASKSAIAVSVGRLRMGLAFSAVAFAALAAGGLARAYWW